MNFIAKWFHNIRVRIRSGGVPPPFVSPVGYHYSFVLGKTAAPAVSIDDENQAVDMFKHSFSCVSLGEENAGLRSAVNQLKFLLSQAPIQMAPVDTFRAACAVTPFAYIHPKTLAKFERAQGTSYARIDKSPTKWVATSFMPEGLVIYTPNPMPGLEKILKG